MTDTKTAINISGECETAYASVADAFETNFKEHGDIGASFCVYQDGEKVVDLWGGHADADRSRPWEKDTLVNVWSTTKGMMALCVARLADQGRLDVGRPVAHYWPEFGANGKEQVTVAQLFSHQAGLCGPDHEISREVLLDTDRLGALLAAQKPQWSIGERSGYHALSIGPLGDCLFKRASGKSVGEYFRDEIAGPCGIDFHMGLPDSQEGRVAEIVHDGNPQAGGAENYNAYEKRAIQNAPLSPYLANERAWRAQGTPSAGGQGNARSVATVYSALATDRTLNGIELVSEEALNRATSIQIENEDLVLKLPMSWGIGFGINKLMHIYGPNPNAFGHHGWGGSFGFADPERGLGVSYTMNYMREPVDAPDPRVMGLIQAVFSSL